MTHAIYTAQQLQLKSIARLKQIYSEIACTAEVTDKRCKDAWISAIVNYQASKVQKLTPTVPPTTKPSPKPNSTSTSHTKPKPSLPNH